MNNIPVISFVAKSGTGKTTLLEKVIKELKGRGLKIAVIKHAQDFEIDQPGKDSWRHAKAGADIVAISSSNKFALIEKRRYELALHEIICRISGVDLILTEGYKKENNPKIEVLRSEVGSKLLSRPEELIAIASDMRLSAEVPCYDIDDAKGIANEIQNYVNTFHKESVRSSAEQKYE
ncbi:MAG: molybdopterin-guanine dinucleotide biosynthesis protein B [Tepidanaerobacteraceae bacterium]|nr:molybdopterin-guanine dinucleotide biosynthesis protein B [Tepidanaerobacteraceae bacterium]